MLANIYSYIAYIWDFMCIARIMNKHGQSIMNEHGQSIMNEHGQSICGASVFTCILLGSFAH